METSLQCNSVKGYDVLIDALALLRKEGIAPPVPFCLEVRGDGVEHAALESCGKAAGLSDIRFTGFTADPQASLAGLPPALRTNREVVAYAYKQAADGGTRYSFGEPGTGYAPFSPYVVSQLTGAYVSVPRLSRVGASDEDSRRFGRLSRGSR